MAFTTQLTVVGGLTRDPELRYTSGGKAVVNFAVASTPGQYNRDTKSWDEGEPVFTDCSAWDEMAENIAASLSKGSRVIVTGTLKSSTYNSKDGNKITKNVLQVTEVGPTLRYHTASVAKRGKAPAAVAQKNSSGQRAAQDEWASTQYGEETPF